MKILYYHQYFKTPRDSGGTRSYEMSKRFIEAGHKVTMVCAYTPSWGLKQVSKNKYRGIIDGIDVIAFDVPYSNKMGLLRRAAAFMQFALKSLSAVLSEDYDLIFATSTPISVALAGIFSKIVKPRKKFVFEVRDLWPAVPIALGVKNPVLIAGMSAFEWTAYRCADGCVGLSEDMVEGIAKRSQKNKPIVLIPNLSETEIFKPSSVKNLELDGVSAGDFTAVFTGAHGVANGLDKILDMACVLKKRGRTDIKILFIGDGKMKSDLMERAQTEGLSCAKFYAPVPKLKLAGLLANAGAGLMILKDVPAFYYGTSPNKFFDYLASGLPIVTNIRGWISDEVRENSCGFAVDAGDSEAFADALCALADDSALRERCGLASRALAVRKYSREILTGRMLEFLEGVCPGK